MTDIVSRAFGLGEVYMVETTKATVHKTIEEHSKLFRDLLLGFVKIHVLYHASKGAIYGVGIASELDQHGYRLSPGTLYPLLHNLEADELLLREDRIVGGKVRKYYRITSLGQDALDDARGKVLQLVNEVTEAQPTQATRTPPNGRNENVNGE